MKKGHQLIELVLLLIVLLLRIEVSWEQEVEVGADGSTTTSRSTSPPFRDIDPVTQGQIQQLMNRASAPPGKIPEYERAGIWRQVLELDPRNGHALLQLGILEMSHPNIVVRNQAMDNLGKAFNEKYSNPTIPMPSPQGLRLAMLLGRYRWEHRDFRESYYYFQKAMQAAYQLADEGTTRVCIEVSLATLLHPFPNTTAQADLMYEQYMDRARLLLQWRQENKHQLPTFEESILAQTVPGAAEDPYVHCVLTLFHLSFYYRADVAEAARLHNQVAASVWPKLLYKSPQVVKPDIPPHLSSDKPCVTRKIRLGIASGFLSPGSSVSADFGGVLQRLNRDIFNVSYIHIKNHTMTLTDPFVYEHRDDDHLLQISRHERLDVGKGDWVTRHHASIEALNLDVLLYLDLTMNPIATRMSMARLAPVQANSHGHPVTSGVEEVDYFISWGAAELEHEVANLHYSEELILLNSHVPHQYYALRYDKATGQSFQDGGFFYDISKRSYFKQYIRKPKKWGEAIFNEHDTDAIHWYTCMQKPHKFMPEMDPLLCSVLKEDPDGILILHKPDTAKILKSFERRLEAAECDMDRVYFIPVLPHHQLMALYTVSTLILDSYPAGGCTTTREALELSKVVVTLPARLLGGRWSYAYYQIMADSVLNKHVIASSEVEYVQKAARLGRDPHLRKEMEDRIEASLKNLYSREEAVRSWEEALLKISPVQRRDQCD